MYNPSDWFWSVESKPDEIFSSALQAFVSADDGRYLAWLDAGNRASAALTVADLQDVLTPFGIYADLSAYAAFKRWEKEVGGVVVSGIPVLTDDRSKQMIMGARIAASANPAFVTTWVGADGGAYPLNATQIVAVSDAVLDHVNACFAAFVSVVSDIKSGATTTLAQIDAAFAA